MEKALSEWVHPVKFVGVNGRIGYCSILAESRVIYLCGRKVVLENTKTSQQKVLWTNQHQGHVELLEHHLTLYDDNLLAVAIRTTTALPLLAIIWLGSLLLDTENRPRQQLHFLRHMEEGEQVTALRFLEEGLLIAVVSCKDNMRTYAIYRCSTGQIIHSESFPNSSILLSSFTLSKLSYLGIFTSEQNSSHINIDQKLTLLPLQELQCRKYLHFGLEKNQKLIQMCLEGQGDEAIFVGLTSLGFFVLFRLSSYQITFLRRLDVKIPKIDGQNSFPQFLQVLGNRAVLGYPDNPSLGMVHFSYFDPRQATFTSVQDTFQNHPSFNGMVSIKISKDGCSLAVVFQIDPLVIQKNCSIGSTGSSEEIENDKNKLTLNLKDTRIMRQISQSNSLTHSSASKQGKQSLAGQTYSGWDWEEEYQQDMRYCVVAHVDLLSNFIDHSEHRESVELTLTACGGYGRVHLVEYCASNNSMMVVLDNRILKYYNMGGKKSINKPSYFINYGEIRPESMLLWSQPLKQKPLDLRCHPFNFTAVIVYSQVVRFHNYTFHRLTSPFLVSNVQNCRAASYSPFGDTLALATQNTIFILNAYTYDVLTNIALPSPPTRITNSLRSVTKLIHTSNSDIIVLSGHNNLFVVLNNQRAVHFGISQQDNKTECVVYDAENRLTALAGQRYLNVLGKSEFGSNGRCQVVSRIQLSATSIILCKQSGILLAGGRDGNIHALPWPHFSSTHMGTPFPLFEEPIVNLIMSPEQRYVYAVSKNGSFAICELFPQTGDEDEKKSYQRKGILGLRLMDRWLVSNYQNEKKDREVIKLRGEEAETANKHINLSTSQKSLRMKEVQAQKNRIESQYTKEMQKYEEAFGLQKIAREVSFLRDEIRTLISRKQKMKQQLRVQNELELSKIFEERSKLEIDLAGNNQLCKIQLKEFKKSLRKQYQEVEAHLYTVLRDLESGKKRQERKELSRILNGKADAVNQEQDHVELKNEIDRSLDQQVKEWGLVNHELTLCNRNLICKVDDLKTKLGEINQQKEKIQVDIGMINQQKEMLKQVRSTLEKESQQILKKYNLLMKKSKQFQESVVCQLKKKERYEFDLKLLELQMNQFEKKYAQLTDKYNQIDRQFILQKDIRDQRQQSLQQAKNKLFFLKKTRKQKFQRSVLIKNQTLSAVKEVEIVKSDYDQKQQSEIEQDTGFASLVKVNDKLTGDGMKWQKVKDTYMNNFLKNYKRLNDENLKLTYRYNDLIKVSQEYKSYIKYLQQQLEKVKRQKYNSAQMENKESQSKLRVKLGKIERESNSSSLLSKQKSFGSFIESQAENKNKQNARGLCRLRKKLVCMSLHQQTGKFITET